MQQRSSNSFKLWDFKTLFSCLKDFEIQSYIRTTRFYSIILFIVVAILCHKFECSTLKTYHQVETITDCKQPLAFQLFCHLFVISMAVITCIIVYSYLYLYIKKKKTPTQFVLIIIYFCLQ